MSIMSDDDEYYLLLSWMRRNGVPVTREKDQSRRLDGSDFPRAMKAIHSLGCEQVFVCAMGMEPWLSFISSIDAREDTVPVRNANALIASCEEHGIPAERLYGRAEG